MRNGWLDGSGNTTRMVLHPEFPFLSREWVPPGLVHGIDNIELGPRCWLFCDCMPQDSHMDIPKLHEPF